MDNSNFNVSSTKLIWEVDNVTPEMFTDRPWVKSEKFYMTEQFPPYGRSEWKLYMERARNSLVCYLEQEKTSSVASISYEMAILDICGRKQKKFKGLTLKHESRSYSNQCFYRLDCLTNFLELYDQKDKLLEGRKIKIVFELDVLTLSNAQHNPLISKQFEELFKSKTFSDFTLVSSDGQKVPVHKNIMSTRSPVFKTMMETQMLTNGESKCKIEDIEARVMFEFIRFVYCGRVKKIDEIAQGLLYAASKYDIPDLKPLCSYSLAKHLSIENVLEKIVFADLHQEHGLKFVCIKFILKHYNKIIKSEGWKDVPVSIFKELLDQSMQKEEEPWKLTSSFNTLDWMIN